MCVPSLNILKNQILLLTRLTISKNIWRKLNFFWNKKALSCFLCAEIDCLCFTTFLSLHLTKNNFSYYYYACFLFAWTGSTWSVVHYDFAHKSDGLPHSTCSPPPSLLILFCRPTLLAPLLHLSSSCLPHSTCSPPPSLLILFCRPTCSSLNTSKLIGAKPSLLLPTRGEATSSQAAQWWIG